MNVKPNTWTIAYRKPRANRFQRVTNWHGTWSQAGNVARKFAETNPDLQVYYVPTLASENGEDAGNVLVDSGKRVRIVDNGELTGNVLEFALWLSFEDAIEHNACIDEAYAGKAEDAGMSIPAYRACLAKHTADGDIFLSGLFTHALLSHMTKVVTFDEGTRYGVSAGDASMYTGEVTDMPKGEMSTCVHCKSVLLTPAKEETISEEMEIIAGNAREVISVLTPFMNRAYSQFIMARDNGSNDELVGTAYQVWKDLDRSIKEMTHTLSLI